MLPREHATCLLSPPFLHSIRHERLHPERNISMSSELSHRTTKTQSSDTCAQKTTRDALSLRPHASPPPNPWQVAGAAPSRKKFAPKIPARNPVKQEPAQSQSDSVGGAAGASAGGGGGEGGSPGKGAGGRGRGRGERGRGRGRGGGGSLPAPIVTFRGSG